MLRGVRGAIQVKENNREAILSGAVELMQALVIENDIECERVSTVLFTVTPDLNAAFPAEVRTEIGWNAVPFLCGQEIPVPDSLKRMIRVLILFETERSQEQIRHQYLGVAATLRPDLSYSEGGRSMAQKSGSQGRPPSK
jgi:chorismate mutase